MLDLLNREENPSMFESFSDLALCTLAVALLLVALLAMSVSQRINVPMNENQFNMDAAPARSYVGCSMAASGDAEADDVLIHLLDAPMVDKLAAHQGALTQERVVRLARERSMPLADFLLLAPGIVPGVDREGNPTLSAMPQLWKPDVFSTSDTPYVLNTDFAEQLMDHLFYANDVDVQTEKRSRIYVESLVQPTAEGLAYYVVIGHAAYPLPEAIEDGSLNWLRSFMAGTVDLIYLGEAGGPDGAADNMRLQFMDANGYHHCAAAYRALLEKPHNPTAVRSLVAACSDGSARAIDRNVLPPFLAYPEAWQAYVQARIDAGEDPPEWFFKECLVKLGFDRMVMDVPAAAVGAQQ